MDSRYSCLKYGFQTKGGVVATGEVPTHDAVIGNGSGKTEFVPPLHAGVLLVRYVCSEADDMPIVKSFESMTKQPPTPLADMTSVVSAVELDGPTRGLDVSERQPTLSRNHLTPRTQGNARNNRCTQ